MIDTSTIPYVHRKTAKGKTYYYFAISRDGERGKTRLVRLPHPSDPHFETVVADLQEQRGRPLIKRRLPGRPKIAEKRPTFVYFIGGNEGPIKIGFSRRPDMRCRDMQTGRHDEVRVLAVVSGNRALEKAYHARFGFAHIRGEWFERRPELVAEIERLATGTKQVLENDA